MSKKLVHIKLASAVCCVALAAAMGGCAAVQQAVYGDSNLSKASVVLTDVMGKDIESISVKAAGGDGGYQALSVDQVIWANGDDAQLNLPFEGKVDVLVNCTDGSSFELHDIDIPSLGSKVELAYDYDLDMAYLVYIAQDGSAVNTLAAEQELLASRVAAEAKASADQKAASKVASKIDAIGKVTLAKEKAIDAAAKAYKKLSKEQKELVDNHKALVKAQAKLKKLKKEKKEAQAKAAAAAAEAAAAQQSSSSGYSSGSSSSGNSGGSSAGGSSSGGHGSSSSSGSHNSGGSSSGGSSGGNSGGSSGGGSSSGGDSGSDTPACDPDAF